MLWVGAVALGMTVIACLLRPEFQPGGAAWYANPIGVPAAGRAIDVALDFTPYLLAALVFFLAIDLVVRWRRSTGIERQQAKFFGDAVVIVVLLLAGLPLLEAMH
jgi:hypothetical protein